MDIFKSYHATNNCPERAGAFPKAPRSQVIAAYLLVLEGKKGPLAADLELPFPKEQIAQAILSELAEDPGCDVRKELEIGYVLLESFVSYDEYRAVEDFKTASFRAERIANPQNPSSILKSARIMQKARGESAVRIQERIHERMQKRQLELSELQKREAA
ncbi:MAG: hypothetical protein P4L55_13185 [Syntrophobacteraceae bacterium]|nr:hypothetical protein [Syntrophobacteraceae bacterium]